jgi:hypothetical protein
MDYRNQLVCRFPQPVRRVEFGPRFISTARVKPSPSEMNRALDPQPSVGAAVQPLDYGRRSLQDMAGIDDMFGMLAEIQLCMTRL